MADNILNLAGNLAPEYALEQQALNRQQQLANLLTQQGTQALPSGSMVSGRFVPTSPFQNLAQLANVAAGQYLASKGEEKALKLAEQLRQDQLKESQDIVKAMRGTPEVVTELAGPAYKGVAPTAVQPGQKADLNEALRLALQSRTGVGKQLLPSIIDQSMPKPTPDIQNYEYAVSKGFKGSFNDWRNQMSEADKARIGIDYARLAIEKEKLLNPTLTESQAKAAVFQSQMIGATNNVNRLEQAGFDPTKMSTQAGISFAGGRLNPVISPEAQQYKQAQDQWSEAYLRFKTGAAATKDEVEKNRKTFFPQFGDTPEQVKQKAEARLQAEQDIGMAAGRGGNRGVQYTTPTAPATKDNKPAKQPEAPQTAYIGNRKIVVRGNGWVYEDNGQAVQ